MFSWHKKKIGFLTGGRSNRFLQLDEGEKDAQRQEAFARAPVPRQSAAVLLRDVPIRYDFFLLVAAWVCPGRSALQSAEQWCQRRYGHSHRVMVFIIKMKQKRAQKGRPLK